jgi:molybdopterin-guanine dinucleotide biosynthesis protein A
MQHGAIVLAGGRSSRMGSSKAWLEWHGATLLERVVAIVGRAVDGGPVVVVAAVGQELPVLPARVRLATDTRDGLGPLQGIASGLEALAGAADVAFVSSTDAALLHPAFVRRVLTGLTDDLDALVPDARGHRQPLAAAYRVELAGTIDALLAEGLAKPAFLYERCRTRFVDEAWLLADRSLAAADPALASLVNLNDPEEYEAARALPLPAVVADLGGRQVELRALTLGDAARALGLDPGADASVRGEPATVDGSFPLAPGDEIDLSQPDSGWEESRVLP